MLQGLGPAETWEVGLCKCPRAGLALMPYDARPRGRIPGRLFATLLDT